MLQPAFALLRHPASRIVLGATAVLALAAPASAQDAADDEPRFVGQLLQGGLFGATRPDENTRHKLDLFASGAGAWEATEAPAFDSTIDDPDFAYSDGTSTVTTFGADYMKRGNRFQFSASGNSALRFQGFGDGRSVSHSAGVALLAPLGRRTNARINHTFMYSPSYLYGLFPSGDVDAGVVPPPTPDYATGQTNWYSYATDAQIERRLSPRNSWVIGGNHLLADFRGETFRRRDTETWEGQTSFNRQLARNTGLRVGYHYRAADFGRGERSTSREQGLDFTVNHSRPLSASRRATLSVRAGASNIETDDDSGGRTIGVGSVTYGHDVRRNVRIQGVYSRDIEYIAELREPLSTNGFTASVQAVPAARWDFSASSGYSRGSSATLIGGGLDYTTWKADAQARFALAPALALFVEGFEYRYDLEGDLSLTDIPQELTRRGVRVGATLFVSVFRR